MRLTERYVLERPLGAGGMAGVFLARDEVDDRQVAIKRLHPEHSNNAEVRARFLREARLVARLSHPNVVQIHDVVPLEDGGVATVMEFVEGVDLAYVLKRRRVVMIPELAAQMIRPIAAALAYVHGEGIIHRDVKPANVLLGKDGAIKLTDFGIARGDEDQGLTQTGAFLGTPAYIPPEQARGQRVTAAADQYALGVMLYQMVTGEKPFAAPSTAEVVLAILKGDYPDPRSRQPAVDDRFATLIRTAMGHTPADRYRDVAAFIDALDACMPPADEASTALTVTRLVSQPLRTADRFAFAVAERMLAEATDARDEGDRARAAGLAQAAVARCPEHVLGRAMLTELGAEPVDPTAHTDPAVVARRDAPLADDATVVDSSPLQLAAADEHTVARAPEGLVADALRQSAELAAPAPSPTSAAASAVRSTQSSSAPADRALNPGAARLPSAPSAPVVTPEAEITVPPAPRQQGGGIAGWKILAIVFVLTALLGGGVTWLLKRDPAPPPTGPEPAPPSAPVD